MNEIMTLINSVLTLMNDIENHIFANHRAKYAGAKTMLDNYREEIEEIRKMIAIGTNEAKIPEMRNDLTSMMQNVNNAHDTGIVAPLYNTKSFDSTIDTMINQLDNNTPETVMPTANIDIQAIENAIPQTNTTLQAEVAPVAPVAPVVPVLEGTQDILPQVEQVVIQEAPTNEVVYEATPAPQILDNPQTEVIQAITPDIIISADTSDQMANIAPTIEIPSVDPMIQVPNVEIPTVTGMADTNQEAGAQ
ncbi:MAG: hypothetical protein K2G03_06935 [Bacilli bacterium]|nr:hypothetical protein [Bacilli bacterium]